MRDLVVGDSVDQYEVIDLLGRSGMASIFKAIDSESGRTVVLKVPHVQYESDVVFYERFQREEEIGQRLDHSNIVRVLTPREKSRMYLAMEYVEGQSLRAVLHSNGPLATERALDVARQLCAALSYLHQNGVVHRDVKPENVLLLPPDGAVKLLDFGIALLHSARRVTWAGLSGTLGTPDYMAPERIRGRRGDARTDVYAIGTILYEMLTGHLPYEAPNAVALLRAKTHRDPTPPREHVRVIHPSLEAIVVKALARDPRDRYATAEEMLADLRDPFAVASRSKAVQGARNSAAPWSWVWRILPASLGVAAGRARLASAKTSPAERSSMMEAPGSRGAAKP
jgi:serine/threonine-protein kinase